MAYSYVLSVSILCTDKPDLLSVKFYWNRLEFCCIFRQTVLGLHCHSLFTVALLSVRDWQKCTCFMLCNVTCLITRMWSVCFLSEVLSCVRFLSANFYTYGLFCSSWQSELENCSTETWRNICIMEESMVSVVCLCVHRNRTSSLLQGKEPKYLM